MTRGSRRVRNFAGGRRIVPTGPFASRPSTGERPPMKHCIARLRDRLTYANVTATLALFIALGGSSYAAITLPRNSVGAKQIRTSAVGSNEIRNGTVTNRDISRRARAALRGQQGPAGPAGPAGPPAVTEHAQFNSLGDMVSGTAAGWRWQRAEPGLYRIQFKRDVSRCAITATLAAVPGGEVTEPSPGRITVASRRWHREHGRGEDLRRRRDVLSAAVSCDRRLLSDEARSRTARGESLCGARVSRALLVGLRECEAKFRAPRRLLRRARSRRRVHRCRSTKTSSTARRAGHAKRARGARQSSGEHPRQRPARRAGSRRRLRVAALAFGVLIAAGGLSAALVARAPSPGARGERRHRDQRADAGSTRRADRENERPSTNAVARDTPARARRGRGARSVRRATAPRRPRRATRRTPVRRRGARPQRRDRQPAHRLRSPPLPRPSRRPRPAPAAAPAPEPVVPAAPRRRRLERPHGRRRRAWSFRRADPSIPSSGGLLHARFPSSCRSCAGRAAWPRPTPGW